MLNWFDLTVLIFMLIAFVTGYRKGLVMMLVGLATVVLAAIFGGRLATIILPELQKMLDLSPQVANVLSYIVSFLAIAIVIGLIGGVVQRIFKFVNLNFINRILGSIVSLGTTMIVLSILLNLVLMLDSAEKIVKPDIREKSFFYDRVRAVVPAIVPYIDKKVWKDYVPEKYRNQIESIASEQNNSADGASIDSSFQKKYFETDSPDNSQ